MCMQEGCKACAFICGRVSCQCMALHDEHALTTLAGVFSKLSRPLQLTEELVIFEKSIDLLVDEAIKELEKIRLRQKAQIEASVARCFGEYELRSKLLARAPVSESQSSGNSFWRLLHQPCNLTELIKPYRYSPAEVDKDIEAIYSGLEAIRLKMEDLWEFTGATYRFSAVQKGKEADLKEYNKRCVKDSKSGTYVMAVVNPSLSWTLPSKISFTVNKIEACGMLGLGICLPDITAKTGHYMHCNYFVIKANKELHGCYILGNEEQVGIFPS